MVHEEWWGGGGGLGGVHRNCNKKLGENLLLYPALFDKSYT
jgi:hypothetical protein